ncbi:MAG: DUF2993 domain-containing protein [Kastovskya adunca ATA6-11-RM4]|jgi:hypothetical protein|nr:DUF2993 domain-containing protein [Kastovskya adunca ATA6-11-RM4]
MNMEAVEPVKPHRSRIISRVLSPALRLWLRSQVEQVEALEFTVEGGDRQILSGHIPKVFVAARYAVYRGLHLSQIQLTGSEIHINLGQVIKGKPLRLLEPIPVVAQLRLEAADLMASLDAPLLSNALTDLLGILLTSGGSSSSAESLKDRQISWDKVVFDDGQLTLSGTITDANHQITPVEICAGLQLASNHTLQLYPLKISAAPELSVGSWESYEIDLGSDVDVQELTLTPGQLVCQGRLMVRP